MINIKTKYYTVTEVFDWGPAITKLVIKFEFELNLNDIDSSIFDIHSIRTISVDQNNSGLADRNFIKRCTVNKVYASDFRGNKNDEGDFLSICLKVGPERIENSPFYYNETLGMNRWLDINYKIELKPNKYITSMTGTPCTIMKIEKEDKLGNYNIVCDAFKHNQKYSYMGIELRYASYTPQVVTGQKSPLIVWLHGAGEGGEDTRIAVLGNRVTNLATGLIQSQFGVGGAHVLIPQAPTMWMDINGDSTYNIDVPNSDGKSYYTEALMHLVDDYVKNMDDIDCNRVYIGGCSNGGYMTIQMIVNNPSYFAAAFPVAAAYHVDWLTDSRLDVLEKTPIWITHAKNDPVVPIDKNFISMRTTNMDVDFANASDYSMIDNFSNALFNRLKARGAKDIHYSLYDNVIDTSDTYKDQYGNPYEYNGHFSWIYVLNNQCVEEIEGKYYSIFEWLSTKSLDDSAILSYSK